MFIFPVQLTTSRIGNLTRLIHSLLYVMTIMTTKTGPDCTVLCDKINKHDTHILRCITDGTTKDSSTFMGPNTAPEHSVEAKDKSSGISSSSSIWNHACKLSVYIDLCCLPNRGFQLALAQVSAVIIVVHKKPCIQQILEVGIKQY